MTRTTIGRMVLATAIVCAWSLAVNDAAALGYGNRGYRSGGCPLSRGGTASNKKPKIRLRIMDHTGKISYCVTTDIERKRRSIIKQYDEALKRWQFMNEAFTRKQEDSEQPLKYEKAKPIEPKVAVLDKDAERNDWAVYEIVIGDVLIRAVDSGHSSASVEARAYTKYARLWNRWVKTGQKGSEPTSPKITKIADSLILRRARKSLRDAGLTMVRLPSGLR